MLLILVIDQKVPFSSLRAGLRQMTSEEEKSFRLYLDKFVFILMQVIFTVVSSELGTKYTITELLKEAGFGENTE